MTKKKVEKQEKKQKKYSTFQLGFVILLTVLLFVLCIIMLVKEISGLMEQQKLMDKFYDYYESKEISVIFYSAEGCIFCELQKPVLEQIAKDYELDYLDLDKMKLSDSNKEKILKELDIEDATPATVVVKNGEVISVQSGYIQGNEYVNFFIKSGVLEDDAVYTPDKNITFIDYAKFKELTLSEEPVVVVIGSATCENCTMARPILSNLASAYNIPIYYITLDYMTAEDRISLVSDLEKLNFDEETFVSESKLYTPTLLVIEDEKIIDNTIGLGNITSYTKLFKETGVIKE